MNPFCNKIGIRYPVLLGGLARIGTAPLAAAVSNAGGLGLLGASVWRASELKEQIRQTRSLTSKVFGVNIPVRVGYAEELVSVVIAEKIPVVSTSAGDPSRFTRRLQENGIFVLHVVSTVDFAVKADQAGVDAVIAEGSESGGMTGREEISTMVLIPQVVDAVKCPVIAAGGFGDGRGLAAALALGAVGIQMGTAFLAVEECEISLAFKEMIVLAKETDTTLIRGEKTAHRMIMDSFFQEAKKFLEKDRPEIIRTLESDPGAGKRGLGQAAGLIHKIRPAADLIEAMIKEANVVLSGIREILPGPGG